LSDRGLRPLKASSKTREATAHLRRESRTNHVTDFDYGLANHAIRITSDRSDCVCLWFWPQMTGITDRMIAAAKQDMWEARREPRGQVFCGERRGKPCDLAIDQLRTWKGLVRVRFECNETAASVLAWAKETGIVLVDDREKLPISSPVFPKPARDRQDHEQSAVLRREAAVLPSPVLPVARRVPASPPQHPKPAAGSTLLPKMPLPPHLQRKG
jgi:hypothetical protein